MTTTVEITSNNAVLERKIRAEKNHLSTSQQKKELFGGQV